MPKEDKNSIYAPGDALYGKKVNVIPQPQPKIGIDQEKTLYKEIGYNGTNGCLDMSAFDSFLNISGDRDRFFSLIDMMAEDPIISAVVRAYVKDITEPNENGDIMWVTSDDSHIASEIQRILDSFRINKNVTSWVTCLLKYGDVYLRLPRQSEFYSDAIFDAHNEQEQSYTVGGDYTANGTKQPLHEDYYNELKNIDESELLKESVQVRVYSDYDPYEWYLEMEPNPAEMFELTRHDTTMGYIKAPVNSLSNSVVSTENWMQSGSDLTRYTFKNNETTIYQATEFVHGYLSNSISRVPEEVQVFITDDTDTSNEINSQIYRVRRGQSILQYAYRPWRELQLLENSLMLNRVTKSSIVRAIQVEVGDMPKEQVGTHLESIKSMMEQKSAIDAGGSMSVYTNPGPVENNVYIPTRGGQGALTVETLGGDVDVKGIADLEYFQDRLFTSLNVPKQLFNSTNDSTGFNGGTSLSQINAEYAKTVMSAQNAIIQAVTDAVNLILTSTGRVGWIRKYKLRMSTPVTQNDKEKAEATATNLQQAESILGIIQGIDKEDIFTLKFAKGLLSDYIDNADALEAIQERIEQLEKEKAKAEEEPQEDEYGIEEGYNGEEFSGEEYEEPDLSDFGMDFINNTSGEYEEPSMEETLPTGEELGVDLTNSEEF